MKKLVNIIFVTFLLQSLFFVEYACADSGEMEIADEKYSLHVGIYGVIGSVSTEDRGGGKYSDAVAGGGMSLGFEGQSGWGIETGYASYEGFITQALISEYIADQVVDGHSYMYVAPTYSMKKDLLYLRGRLGLAFWSTDYRIKLSDELFESDREERDDSGQDVIFGVEAGFAFTHVELALRYENVPTDLVDTSAFGFVLNYTF